MSAVHLAGHSALATNEREERENEDDDYGNSEGPVQFLRFRLVFQCSDIKIQTKTTDTLPKTRSDVAPVRVSGSSLSQ